MNLQRANLHRKSPRRATVVVPMTIKTPFTSRISKDLYQIVIIYDGIMSKDTQIVYSELFFPLTGDFYKLCILKLEEVEKEAHEVFRKQSIEKPIRKDITHRDGKRHKTSPQVLR